VKRLHVNLSVHDLERSIRFYSALFAVEPVVRKEDYAKWMLDDPRVNFAITTRGTRKGVDHLGIQVDAEPELAEVYGRLKEVQMPVFEEGATVCCYARSEKSWVFDPEGVAWETFLTHGASDVYGADVDLKAAQESACCAAPGDTAEPAGACCG
jgi:catechol 2,3-dioxygenase-like lactoylglutathione lyase family enzyme